MPDQAGWDEQNTGDEIQYGNSEMEDLPVPVRWNLIYFTLTQTAHFSPGVQHTG